MMVNANLDRRLVLAALGAAAATAACPRRPRAAETVSVQLDYVVRGNHAMFFVARERGYFAEEGIEVAAIRKGTGSVDAMRLVGNGNAEFGFGDLPTLAVARSQDVPVVALAAVNQVSPMGMVALARKHELKAPADLKGLNVGIHPAGSTYIFFKTFLAANGLAEGDMTISTVSPPYESYLLLERVDAVVGYIDAEVPELEAKAGGDGSLSIILGSDFGYPCYGSGLFTAEAIVAEKPELVQGFTRAYLRAFADVVRDPAAAVEITVKANPEYAAKTEVLKEQLAADIASTFSSPDTEAHGLGWMTEAKWAATTKVLLDQGAMKTPIDVAKAFDVRFLQAAAQQ